MTRTLAIDIGGTGLKASIIDEQGEMVTERARVDTPSQASPARIVTTLAELVRPLGAFDRVSVGFPGMVRDGRVLSAPNLGTEAWKGTDLAAALSTVLGKPVRVVNDADMQGFAAIGGRGVEMVVTLGTGFGSSIFVDGRIGPHLELAHHPFRQGETYDQQLGNAARKAIGPDRWNRRVRKAIANLRSLTWFDRLYIGGGNAKKLRLELDPDTLIVSNEAGMRGGIALWRD